MSQLLSRAFTARPYPGEVTMSKRPSRRVAARVASKRAFARVHPAFGLVAHSPEVLGMARCLDSTTQSGRPTGAYCFKLSFTPVAVIANNIAHPDDDASMPILCTAGPNVTGQFTKDKYGHGVECPARLPRCSRGRPIWRGRRISHSVRRHLRNVLRLIS